MNRLISDILGAPEPHFSHTLREWEAKIGNKGNDIHLLSDIATKRRHAMTSLGVNSDDISGRELYYLLRNKASENNTWLEKEIGITDKDSSDAVLKTVLKLIESLKVNREVWIIKSAVLKQLIKKQPPKKLMKCMGLRSVDSMVKRSNPYEIVALAYQVEAPEWVNKFQLNYKKLKVTDFQSGKAQIIHLSKVKVEKLRKGGLHASKLVLPNFETGTVVVMPSAKRFNMDTLGLTLTIIQSMYDLKVHSAYYRHLSVKNNFGQKFYESIRDGLPGKIHSKQIGWRALQKHFNRYPDSFEQFEQPHLQSDDIKLHQATRMLAGKVPGIGFWEMNSHVFYSQENDRPVSFNLMDVIVNASNQVPYEKSSNLFLQGYLWDELSLIYLREPQIFELIVKNIDSDQV